MIRLTLGVILTAFIAMPAAGQGDPEVIDRIIEEGTNDSQVWEHLMHLSEEIGPRLTGSTRLMEANAWTRDMFRTFGLQNVHLQRWGEVLVRFDRGPSWARMVEPEERELEFTSPAWSPGTSGPVQGLVVKAPESMEEFEEMREQLVGAWVLSKARRWNRRRGRDRDESATELRDAIDAAGILGRIHASSSDLVRTNGRRGWRDLEYDNLPTDLSISVRRIDYDAMNSRIADGDEVIVAADLQHHFVEGPFPLFNTVAEIPGTERSDEVVIVSGHLDSWDGPGSMGTQDNGTGTSVTLEAARLLMAAGAKPKRTIRFILWTGEEQGLLGSRAYVESLSEEERAKISAVLVDDGGTNYQGGLVCIEPMADMLAEATARVNETFPDMPVEIDVRERMPRGGGSDHASFNRQGIPGFFWTEKGSGGREGKNYRFIHHTQHDTPRYAVEEYLVQSAVCSAITAYNLANAETLLPREPQDPPSSEEERRGPSAEDDGKPWTIVSGPLTGEWVAALDEAPDRTFTLTFEMADDGRVRGTMDSRVGQGPLQDVVWNADEKRVRFNYSSQMGRMVFAGQIQGEELKGSMSVGDQFSADFTAKRTVTGEAVATDTEATEAQTETEGGATEEEAASAPPSGGAAGG